MCQAMLLLCLLISTVLCQSTVNSGNTAGLTLLTTFQWFGGRTWGCLEHCKFSSTLFSRQLELTHVLSRNALHPSVAAIHILVGELGPVWDFLQSLAWFKQVGSKVCLYEIGKRPTFADFFDYASNHLQGRTVVLLNQDIFLRTSTPSFEVAAGEGYFMARYAATKSEGFYNVMESRKALQARVGNMSSIRSTYHFPCISESPHSTCSGDYWGSLDIYAFALSRPLPSSLLKLLDFPMNAVGGENTLVLVCRHVFNWTLLNPCPHFAFVHLHCHRTDKASTPRDETARALWRDVLQPQASKILGYEVPGAGFNSGHGTVWPAPLRAT